MTKNYAQKNELNYNWIDCQTTWQIQNWITTRLWHYFLWHFPLLRDFQNFWNHVCNEWLTLHVLKFFTEALMPFSHGFDKGRILIWLWLWHKTLLFLNKYKGWDWNACILVVVNSGEFSVSKLISTDVTDQSRIFCFLQLELPSGLKLGGCQIDFIKKLLHQTFR